jgi:diguanylate cyclase (GGDEF)-like protein
LLDRQLRRVGLDPQAHAEAIPALGKLLDRVSRAYADSDQDRYVLDRSQDIASREMAHLNVQLTASQARLASLVSLSADWVWEQDEGLRFTYLSDHLSSSGTELKDLLASKRAVADLTAASQAEADRYEALVARRQPFRNMVFGMGQEDGQPFYARLSGEPVFDGAVFRGYRGVGSDVTQATLAEQQVQQLASYDSLTGLVNRNMFLSQLDKNLDKAVQASSTFSLLFIDLDRFKAVNDTLGHAAGDELLKTVSGRLKRLLPDHALIGRLGGDEFVVLLDGAADPFTLSTLASRLLKTLAKPMQLVGRSVQISGSIGISQFPADGVDAPTLLKCADTAMYQAKAHGKNNVQIYTAKLAELSSRHFELEAELRLAIDRNELCLHYQPRFDLATRQICAMEALVRWQHPSRGLLLPDDFLKVAVDSDLVVPMGLWVLNEVCRQLRAWRDSDLGPPRCSINLSARQFVSDTLEAEVHTALNAHALEPAALEIDLTECVWMVDPDRARLSMDQLHAMGVHMAIDGFGTGYSSLSDLKRFPAKTLKIDRSFVNGLPDQHDDVVITQAVVSLAHALGKRVVAVGVESEAQMCFLAEAACHEVQGFVLSRPVEPQGLAVLLRSAAVPTEAAAGLSA